MSEKTKRSRSIYTVNEKASEVTPPAPPTPTTEVPALAPIERKLKDYTPEWRKIPSVGSFGDFDRGETTGFPKTIPADLYYSHSNTSHDFLKPGKRWIYLGRHDFFVVQLKIVSQLCMYHQHLTRFFLCESAFHKFCYMLSIFLPTTCL